MTRSKLMRLFAKWHIWLGWLVGVPVLMWTVTGLVMVITPIEEVRGNHLRVEIEQAPLPAQLVLPDIPDAGSMELRAVMQGDRPVWFVTDAEGNTARYAADGTGAAIAEADEAYARALVAERIIGGDNTVAFEAFGADNPPFDFRRPVPTWRATLEDGTHIYIDRTTGEIAAIRTRWWRVFDFMWGLHIMDLQTREDTSHPILILFAALGVIGSLLGCVLMFRRRKSRIRGLT